jgi:5-methylcytosine-specific restriction endonuclease McrA
VADDILKACSKCKRHLALSSFAADRRASDGLQSQCRECANTSRREKQRSNPEDGRKKRNAYYRDHKAAILASNAKSRIKRADQIKAHKRAAYLRDKERPEFIERLREYGAANKDAKREYDRAYRRKNADKLDAIKKAWRAENKDKVSAVRQNYKHRRRAQEEGGISSADLLAWKRAQPKVCYWCGKKCAKNSTVDHYVALSKGGKHEASNLVIACRPCNVKKSAKDPEQFRAETWHGTLFSHLVSP